MWFIDWLKGDMGSLGEFQYTYRHLVPTAIVLLLTVLVGYLGGTKRISDKNKRKILIGISIFFIFFETFWRVIYLTLKHSNFSDIWPMYPCNLGGVLLPIIAILNNKTLKKIFYLFGIVGAVLTFALPEGIFCNTIFVFPILKSVLQHTGLFFIPVFEYASGTFRPSIKDYPFLVLGCTIHLLNAEVIDRFLGLTGDYMFFRSGMPFVINGVPQWITFSVFGLVVFALISYLVNIKESNEFLKSLKKNK